jgi:hypothetical protein
MFIQFTLSDIYIVLTIINTTVGGKMVRVFLKISQNLAYIGNYLSDQCQTNIIRKLKPF